MSESMTHATMFDGADASTSTSRRRTRSPAAARRTPLEVGFIATKRSLDVTLGLVLLVLTAPIHLAAALAVKLGDGGPVLFRQECVGRDGELFHMFKLRTMHVDAEQRLAELPHLTERDARPRFELTDDPRVTRVGRLLRATSIDELPQLFQVVSGAMSLVGPRPALPSEVAVFDDRLASRNAVRPGITGLWQAEGGTRRASMPPGGSICSPSRTGRCCSISPSSPTPFQRCSGEDGKSSGARAARQRIGRCQDRPPPRASDAP